MLLRLLSPRTPYRQIVMPLRAKILDPAVGKGASQSASYATSPPVIKELPGDEPNDVLFSNLYGLRSIQLNRPKKLNSLNGSMIRKILPRMQEWDKSQLANVVVIKGEGRAFCAGGDVAALAEQNNTPEGQQASTDYFALEYQLDHYIATYRKPYVAFIDGITMGGGVGLSVHAPFRIATENTVFAMPETTIGLFPDVGAGFFLPRMDGALGLYLALTSEQLKGVNVFYSGVATHYLHSSSLPDLEARFSELKFRDNDSFQHRLQIVNATIEEFNTGLPHDQPISAPVSGPVREAVDFVFQYTHSYGEIMSALDDVAVTEAASEEVHEWAKKTKKTILQRSPTSVLVTIQQLRRGRDWSIAQTFRKEHQIAARFMRHPDFVEGVSSLLIRKPRTTPQWSPSSAAQVPKADVNSFFPATADLQLLSTGDDADYTSYPHAWIGLPTEREVGAFVQSAGGSTKAKVIKHFVNKSNGKVGVQEKVAEILSRKTKARDDGAGITWSDD